jgi:hypothetical protein
VKNTAIILLGVAVGILSLFAYSLRINLEQQRRQVQELTAKLDSAPNTATLELQDKCATQARERFNLDWEGRPPTGVTFTDHYNPQLSKCFLLTLYVDNDIKYLPGKTGISRALYDAVENRQYAEYFWIGEKNKKYSDVPPSTCKVTLQSGEERICHSSQEFNTLLRQYMESGGLGPW